MITQAERISKAFPRINIKDLILPDSKKEANYVFNPCDIVDDVDWQRMIQNAQEKLKRLDPDTAKDLRKLLYSMCILFPEKKAGLGLNKTFQELLQTTAQSKTNLEKIIEDAHMLTLFGMRPKGVTIFSSYELSQSVRNSSMPESRGALEVVACFTILNKDVSIDDLRADDNFKRSVKTIFNGSRATKKVEIAANSRIVFGTWDFLVEDKNEFWKSKHGHLLNFVRTVWPITSEYADLAASLKILAAEKVIFGERGIELEMPKPAQEDSFVLPLPRSRRF